MHPESVFRVLLIGPMPDPITGVSFANESVCRYLEKKEASVVTVNTHVAGGVSNAHGRFSFRKVINFLQTYLSAGKAFYTDVLYMTPGQTFLGLVKYAPFMLLALLARKPYVIHLHGNHMGKEYRQLAGLKKKIFRLLVGNAAAGIVLSESLRANFEGLLPSARVYVVPNFVEEDFMEQASQNKSLAGLSCLYFSNLMKTKGCIDFLMALLILKEKGLPFAAVVAGGYEEESREEVSILMEKLKPEVSYVGVLKGKDKVEAFRSSNVFVLPTYYPMEGQPIAILEAMASGSLIVTTKHAGIPDILDETNAIFTSYRSPEDIASILQYVYDNNTVLKAFYQANTAKARKEFREERFGMEIYTILKAVCKNVQCDVR